MAAARRDHAAVGALLLISGAPGPAQAAVPEAFVLPARSSAVIRFVAFCRDFGGRFLRAIGQQHNFRAP